VGLTDLEGTYRRYFPVIREKCRRMLKDHQESQDVAQETFVRLWRSSIAGEEPARVLHWIYRTSTRLAIDRMRQRRFRGEAIEMHQLALPSSTDGLDASVEVQQAIALLAREVPPQEMEVALLDRLDGLSHRELADVAGVSERTVRRLLARFERHLRQLFPEGSR
jgi:RNA polymerase sigma-70 factor, ECF subfamily